MRLLVNIFVRVFTCLSMYLLGYVLDCQCISSDQNLLKKIINLYADMSRVMRKPNFAYAKTKTQISFAVTAKLISAFVFATYIDSTITLLSKSEISSL